MTWSRPERAMATMSKHCQSYSISVRPKCAPFCAVNCHLAGRQSYTSNSWPPVCRWVSASGQLSTIRQRAETVRGPYWQAMWGQEDICGLFANRLLLDSRVVDVSRLSNRIVVTLSSLKPLFFNGLKLYFPVTAGVMPRVACHRAWALPSSVGDARRRLWASARWATVFCAVAVAAPARLENAPGPAPGAADQGSGGESDPRSRAGRRAAWRRWVPRGSLPAAPALGGVADGWGRRRIAALPRASAGPTGATPPLASGPDLTPVRAPHGAAATC
jgi:hypothetical protein